MPKIVYEVIEHDGGWAYRMHGAFSESFPSHSDAMQAALIAATAQQKRLHKELSVSALPGQELGEPINFEILDRSQSLKRLSLSSSL